jgi:hypothetical protein
MLTRRATNFRIKSTIARVQQFEPDSSLGVMTLIPPKPLSRRRATEARA